MQTAGRSDWIVAICSVVFDLDVGQQLESVYPAAAISESTATSVAFHSFPVSARDECNLAVKQHEQPVVCKRHRLLAAEVLVEAVAKTAPALAGLDVHGVTI